MNWGLLEMVYSYSFSINTTKHFIKLSFKLTIYVAYKAFVQKCYFLSWTSKGAVGSFLYRKRPHISLPPNAEVQQRVDLDYLLEENCFL